MKKIIILSPFSTFEILPRWWMALRRSFFPAGGAIAPFHSGHSPHAPSAPAIYNSDIYLFVCLFIYLVINGILWKLFKIRPYEMDCIAPHNVTFSAQLLWGRKSMKINDPSRKLSPEHACFVRVMRHCSVSHVILSLFLSLSDWHSDICSLNFQ